MKRYFITLCCLLLCMVARSQNANTYRCWFDQDFANEQTGALGNGQLLLDASSLEAGLHTLYVMLEGEQLTTAENYMFYKAPVENPTNLDNLTYHCWFDQDIEHKQTGTLGNGQLLLDADDLSAGLHTLYVMLEGDQLTTAENYMFYKAPVENPTNLDNLTYHCWFDQDIEHKQTGTLGNGQLLLDADDLSAGLHTLYVMLEGEQLTTAENYMFYKAFVENPTNLDNLTYHCWFDQDIEHEQTGALDNGQLLLDADDLLAGLHTLYVMLEGDQLTTAENYMFYKAPVEDPINMDALTYHCWFDQDIEHKQTGALDNGQLLLDADDLSAGLHTLYVMLEGEQLTTTENYMFYKAPIVDPINMNNLVFQYWFDEDFEQRHEVPFGTGQYLLDASALEDGSHVINIMLKGETLTAAESYSFEKGFNGHIIITMANPIDGGVITGAGAYEEGQMCTLKAIANPNYAFVNWTEDDNPVSNNPTYRFEVSEDRTLTANFNYNPVGNFAYMYPYNNYPVTTLPINFSWNAVSGAQHYDLYLWNTNEQVPDEPIVSGLTTGYYSCASLPNHETYQWFVKAYNPYNVSYSNIRYFTLDVIRYFTLDVDPAINVSTNNIHFGEVVLNQSASHTLQVSGVILEDDLNIEIVGEDAAMFSFTESSNWNSTTGGNLTVTFTPTSVQYEYHATLVISSGSLTQSVALSGSVANVYVFNTYVDEDVYAMNSIIPIHGTVTDNENAPVANAEVEIGIHVMGLKRSLQATTNENGEFAAEFEPMDSESGYYTVNSGHVGNNSTAVHDEFNIPGMTIVADSYILCAVTQNQPKTASISMRNKCNLELNNIQVSVISAPEGCSINFMPLNLGGLETGDLVYTVNGTQLTQGNYYQEIKLKATSDLGAETNFSIWYYCAEPKGILDVSPKQLATNMTRGQSKIVDVKLSNNGTAATGEITIDLPETEWMSVVGNDTLPSLAVNDSAYFSLRLSPDESTPLIPFEGNIAINCEHGEFASLPFSITAVSESTGALTVDVTDEFTYYGNGQHLANAEVTLKGYYSLETVGHGYTDANGMFSMEDLPEGYYRVNVKADRHSEFNEIILIEAGTTNQRDIFLQYQAVTYSWEVIPTEIGDEYTIILDGTFETNVPVPVVIIEAPHQIPDFEDSYSFNYVVTNHGLIDAYGMVLHVPEDDEFLFTPLYDHKDTLFAQSSIVIPCVVTHKDNDTIECADWGRTWMEYHYTSGPHSIYGYGQAYTILGTDLCDNALPTVGRQRLTYSRWRHCWRWRWRSWLRRWRWRRWFFHYQQLPCHYTYELRLRTSCCGIRATSGHDS